jgi:signal transduction histidine kinase
MEMEMDTSAWEMLGRTPLAVNGLNSLTTDTTARWQVEAALEERVRFETFLAGLSSMFGKGPDDAVPAYIRDGLRQVVEFLHIDQSTLLEFSRDQSHLEAIHSYAAPGIPPYPARPLDRFPWLIKTLRSGKTVCFARLDELPAESWAEKESWRRAGCRSSLMIPLLSAGEVRYAMTFGSFRAERTWPAELIPQLRLVGEIFANAMSRKHSAEAISRLQDELVHWTRVTMPGESAATLAHELARPLAAILSNAQAAQRFLTMESPQLGEVQEALGDVVHDTRRATELLQRLRALAKKTNPKRTVFDMHELVREVIQLVDGEASAKQISLRLQLRADPPHVCGDRVQLQQVVLNLILNAIEAIREAPDGPRQIVVRTGHEPPATMTVAVRDSGIGLDAIVLPRIFDPFFSTKAEGMGMGLAISRSIIISHHGRIWASPNPGQGLTVSFSIPTGASSCPTRRSHDRA